MMLAIASDGWDYWLWTGVCPVHLLMMVGNDVCAWLMVVNVAQNHGFD
jgi:hypothetical protein